MFNEIKKTITWNGEKLEISTGKIARQADGAVMVKMGDSVVLCTAVAKKEAQEDPSFFPLTVTYQEKFHAVGKIPGGFFKKEGKSNLKETLTSRLIDRPIRPLFHSHFFNETQVICTVHSFDERFNTDILALIGASAAIAISGMPVLDIVAASRVGLIDKKFVLNPSVKDMQESKLDLVVAGTKNSVMMVESEANFLSEEKMIEAVEYAHNSFQPVIDLIKDLKNEIGNKEWDVTDLCPDELQNKVKEIVGNDIEQAFAIKSKQERGDFISKIKSNLNILSDENYSNIQIDLAFSKLKAQILRSQLLDSKIRIDGRKTDEIRKIDSEVSLLPNTHGSALFTRGETQALVTTTLGTGQDAQIVDSVESDYKETFLLDYIFPPYSTGEVSPLRSATRREIGHGKLAWRALKNALPNQEQFPYTLRVVSEICESNGSSSMATICGSSMAMMDAGVPLKSPISGIAMGLVKEGDKFVILSDIIADEDHLGDMDFKVAGGKDGVTALQMDIKVSGISFDIMKQALSQAKEGRMHILEKMSQAIDSHNSISKKAPSITSMSIDPSKIKSIIGTGGKMIKELCQKFNAKIEVSDDGKVSIATMDQENLDKLITTIKDIVTDPKVGDTFTGKVVKIIEAGAFVNYATGRDGFVHISEISHERIESVSSVLREGEEVKVKLIGFDRGKAKLTIKNLTSDNYESSRDQQRPRRKFSSGDNNSRNSFDKSNNRRDGRDNRGNRGNSEGNDNKRKYFN